MKNGKDSGRSAWVLSALRCEHRGSLGNLCFSNLPGKQILTLSALADLIRASLVPVRKAADLAKYLRKLIYALCFPILEPDQTGVVQGTSVHIQLVTLNRTLRHIPGNFLMTLVKLFQNEEPYQKRCK